MLIFAGLKLAGLHAAPQIEPPKIEAVRTKFFGVLGESEIIGKPAGRSIHYPIWIFDSQQFGTAAALYAFLTKLDTRVGLNGQLEELDAKGAVLQTFKNVTFDGFQRMGTVLQDVAGTLGGGFWIPGMLMFYDLGGD